MDAWDALGSVARGVSFSGCCLLGKGSAGSGTLAIEEDSYYGKGGESVLGKVRNMRNILLGHF